MKGGEHMSVLSRYERYVNGLLGGKPCFDFLEKDKCTNQHISYMLNRTQSMFKWNGLPETIPQRNLELMLQMHGNIGIASVDGLLYAFIGGLGGEPNPYYMPTIYTIANPALKLSKNYTIDEDIIIIPNDSLYIGLLPLFERYASAITETEVSLFDANINSRIISLITANDDRTKASAEKYISDIISGKISIIANDDFLGGLNSQPYANTGHNSITDLIELEQYLKASWFNELGLNANYNMKRESINSGESQLNNDMLLPLVDDMLKQRQEGAEKVNNMFGTNISVDLASSWKDNQEEVDKALYEISNEEMKEGVENDEETERPL